MMRSVATLVNNHNLTMSISNDGSVYSFGYSDYGTHGSEEKVVSLPTKVLSLHHITAIALSEHAICLDYDGNVFTFGCNEYGQLGINLSRDSLPFTNVPQKVNLPPCKEVACGVTFSMCLLEGGLIYAFGFNEHGQLGLGNNEFCYSSPQLIQSLKDVEFIECGPVCTFCKTENNQIFCWGINTKGELGMKNVITQNTPYECKDWPGEDIVDIRCGDGFTVILTSNGEVFSCGGSLYPAATPKSELERIESLSEITRMSCGYHFAMFIDANHDLYVMGDNINGELGLGDASPLKISINEITKHPSLSNIIDMSSRGFHTFVKTSSNEIYAFGDNDNSKLGIETQFLQQRTPIQVFQGKEDIWCSHITTSKAKSARK